MKVNFSEQASRDLQNVPKLDRPRLGQALDILQYEAFPTGLFETIDVESRPIDILSIFKPHVHRLCLNEPPSEYRIIYFYDEENDTVYIVFIRHRDRAYPKSLKDVKNLEDMRKYIKEVREYRKKVRSIMRDYFQNRRWENAR